MSIKQQMIEALKHSIEKTETETWSWLCELVEKYSEGREDE